MAAQTPTQRRANERFAKREERKKGKSPEKVAALTEKKPRAGRSRLNLSKPTLALLAFLVIGGAILQFLFMTGLY